ncbi:hypothetical protein HU200_025571 [Digitaria exilis]|uniref:C2 domain-containing protein n=1 Tax=Digitaria exilis TaxID=1010633 RepID=A0A835C2K8_9POAL|nr:hypothetical protein HU200_025571 [Digitaria exilis]
MEAPDEEAGLGLPEGERLLEVTLISAQGLKPPSGLRRRLQAYAVAWVDAGHKLQTRPDAAGGLDPAWHARFLFRVREASLADDSRAAVSVEIYAAAAGSWHLGGDSLVGSARFLLGDHRLLHRPVGSPSMFAVGVRRPSGRVHGLLNVAASLVAVPPSPAACHALRLSPAVSLSGISVAPNPSRVLRVLNRAHHTPPPSPKLLTPKKQQMVVKPNIKVADDGSDEEGDEEEARGMGGMMFCGPCVLPFPTRKIHTSPSDENLQAFAGIFSAGLRQCRTEP